LSPQLRFDAVLVKIDLLDATTALNGDPQQQLICSQQG
jgi:hypothetical protein